MDLSSLLQLALSSVDEPWGLGDPFLQNSESQPAYLRFLHKIVKTYKPQLVVECGVYMATCSVHMALGCDKTKVVGIDRAPHSRAYSALLLYNNFHFVLGDSTSEKIYVEVCEKFGEGIGLIFLDSEHDGVTATEEFNLWRSAFSNECLVACDDILDPRMKHFWDNLPGEKMEMNFLHTSQYAGYPEPGFGVSIVRNHGSSIKHNHST